MKLLLDEHLSPKVVEIVLALSPGLDIESIRHWKGGQFTNRPDEQILRAAAGEGRVLVTFDVRTIPPILAEFGVAGEDHGGVIFVSAKSIPQNDFARLARAIVQIVEQQGDADWTNRLIFLSRE
jgi:predicted nuclease of predicted toxin-antitoxin system